VQLVGSEQKLSWKQTAEGLRVTLPTEHAPASEYAAAFKVLLA
jgi:hypothetical protein